MTAHSRETLAARDDAGSSEPRPARRAPGATRGLTAALAALRAGPACILMLLVVVARRCCPTSSSRWRTSATCSSSRRSSASWRSVSCSVIVTRGIDLSVGSNLSLSAVVGAIVWRDQGSATLGRARGPRHRRPASAWSTACSTSKAGCRTPSSRRWPCSPPRAVWRCSSPTARPSRAPRRSSTRSARAGSPRSRAAATSAGSRPPRSSWSAWRSAHAASPAAWCGAAGSTRSAATRRRPCATASPCRAVLISVYVLCGLLAGVAALLTMGKGDAGSPTSGALAELDAIAAVIIGGPASSAAAAPCSTR